MNKRIIQKHILLALLPSLVSSVVGSVAAFFLTPMILEMSDPLIHRIVVG